MRIEDEDGKIDLNLAPTELLAGLCAELGITDDACAGPVDGLIAATRRKPKPRAATDCASPHRPRSRTAKPPLSPGMGSCTSRRHSIPAMSSGR
jgi:hypothetical protein